VPVEGLALRECGAMAQRNHDACDMIRSWHMQSEAVLVVKVQQACHRLDTDFERQLKVCAWNSLHHLV